MRWMGYCWNWHACKSTQGESQRGPISTKWHTSFQQPPHVGMENYIKSSEIIHCKSILVPLPCLKPTLADLKISSFQFFPETASHIVHTVSNGHGGDRRWSPSTFANLSWRETVFWNAADRGTGNPWESKQSQPVGLFLHGRVLHKMSHWHHV